VAKGRHHDRSVPVAHGSRPPFTVNSEEGFFYTESIKNFYPLPHETDVIVCVAVAAIDGVCKA
jgi:hypothetical protein